MIIGQDYKIKWNTNLLDLPDDHPLKNFQDVLAKYTPFYELKKLRDQYIKENAPYIKENIVNLNLFDLWVFVMRSEKQAIINRSALADRHIFNRHMSPLPIVRLLASIRLCSRSNKRLIKNREYYTSLYDSGDIPITRIFTSFCLGWMAEKQSITTVNFAETDQLDTFTSYDALAGQIKSIQSIIKDSTDGDIAAWVRRALNGEDCKDFYYNGKPGTINISEKHKTDLKRFLLHTTHLLFSTEVRRNPAALIHNQMMLDLLMVQGTDLSWSNFFAGAPTNSGGMMPMSMLGAVMSARALHKVYSEHGLHKYRYSGESHNLNNSTFKDLVRREYEICERWDRECTYEKFGKTFVERVKYACENNWYKDLLSK